MFMVKTISVETLKEKIRLNEDFLFIDVREPIEREAGFIENDINIPLSELSNDTLPTTDKSIIIYCRSGVRSFNACEALLAQNENLNIFNLGGGFLAWHAYTPESSDDTKPVLIENMNTCTFPKNKPCLTPLALIGGSIFLGLTISALFYIVALLSTFYFLMKNKKDCRIFTKLRDGFCKNKKCK